MKRRTLLHVVLPLALGVAVYLLFRDDDLALFRACDALGLTHVLAATRLVTRPLAHAVPRILLGSAPDFAWAYAFGAGMALVWMRDRGATGARAWIGVGLACALAIEIGQGIGIVPGVFDAIDLVAIGAGYVFGVSRSVVVRPVTHAV